MAPLMGTFFGHRLCVLALSSANWPHRTWVVVDFEPFQRSWHGFTASRPKRARWTSFCPLDDFAPNVVYLQNLSVLSDATMQAYPAHPSPQITI